MWRVFCLALGLIVASGQPSDSCTVHPSEARGVRDASLLQAQATLAKIGEQRLELGEAKWEKTEALSDVEEEGSPRRPIRRVMRARATRNASVGPAVLLDDEGAEDDLEGQHHLVVGKMYEGKDAAGTWWPIIITKHTGDGTFVGIVQKRNFIAWKQVFAENVRGKDVEDKQHLHIGHTYEGKDSKNNWWPMIITAKNDDGTYNSVVQDRHPLVWSSIYPVYVRPVPEAESAKLPICHETMVKDACDAIAGEEHATQVTWKDIDSMTIASYNTTIQLADDLGFDKSKPHMDCTYLCTTLKKYIAAKTKLPPSSDIGCASTDSLVVCDVNLDPGMLERKLGVEKVIKEGQDKQRVTRPSALASETEADEEFDQEQGWGSKEAAVPYQSWDLAVRLANLFRFFPASHRTRVIPPKSASGIPGTSELQTSTEISKVQKQIATQALEAKGWLNTVIKEVAKGNVAKYQRQWFGGPGKGGILNPMAGKLKKDEVKLRIMQVLNFVEYMVTDAVYVYPADPSKNGCEGSKGPGTLAWVYGEEPPKKTKSTFYITRQRQCGSDVAQSTWDNHGCARDSAGRFIVYLCERWYKWDDEIIRIETLIHEMVHHTSATDFSYDPDEMKSMSQRRQMKNADNYALFVEDITLDMLDKLENKRKGRRRKNRRKRKWSEDRQARFRGVKKKRMQKKAADVVADKKNYVSAARKKKVVGATSRKSGRRKSGRRKVGRRKAGKTMKDKRRGGR